MTFVEIVHQDDVLIEYAPNIITQVGELFLFVSGGGDGMYFNLDDDVWPVDWVRANAHRLVTEHGPGRHRIEHPGVNARASSAARRAEQIELARRGA